MRIIPTLAGMLLLEPLLIAGDASALVTAPVGGHVGETTVSAGATLERGKIEPNENERSWQSAAWEIYSLSASHTLGDTGPLQDFFLGVSASAYDSPAERIPAGDFSGTCGGELLGSGACEVHPDDQGQLLSAQIGFNLLHQPDFSLGLFVLGTVPLGVNFEKFALPRTDLVALGSTMGLRLKPWLTYESQIYLGSGPLNQEQNATVALVNNFGLHGRRWLFGQNVGVRFGPYFDADLTERFDPRYDQTFIAGVPVDEDATTVTAAGTRDRIRMMRFGATVAPYANLSEDIAVELNYTQKLFGYDTPATQFFRFSIHASF